MAKLLEKDVCILSPVFLFLFFCQLNPVSAFISKFHQNYACQDYQMTSMLLSPKILVLLFFYQQHLKQLVTIFLESLFPVNFKNIYHTLFGFHLPHWLLLCFLCLLHLISLTLRCQNAWTTLATTWFLQKKIEEAKPNWARNNCGLNEGGGNRDVESGLWRNFEALFLKNCIRHTEFIHFCDWDIHKDLSWQNIFQL